MQQYWKAEPLHRGDHPSAHATSSRPIRSCIRSCAAPMRPLPGLSAVCENASPIGRTTARAPSRGAADAEELCMTADTTMTWPRRSRCTRRRGGSSSPRLQHRPLHRTGLHAGQALVSHWDSLYGSLDHGVRIRSISSLPPGSKAGCDLKQTLARGEKEGGRGRGLSSSRPVLVLRLRTDNRYVPIHFAPARLYTANRCRGHCSSPSR